MSRLLLDEAFSLSLTDIAYGAVSRLSEADTARLENYIQQLERGVPVQYVLGYEWFHELRIGVSPAVLIPRPETAQLVDETISEARQMAHDGTPLHILDIGTGSGFNKMPSRPATSAKVGVGYKPGGSRCGKAECP